MATVQLRNPGDGRDYYDRKKSSGKSSMEAMRCLKRRLSDLVYRTACSTTPTTQTAGDGSGRATGATTLTPARPAHNPNTGSSDKPLRDPSTISLNPLYRRCLDTEGSHERSLRRLASAHAGRARWLATGSGATYVAWLCVAGLSLWHCHLR